MKITSASVKKMIPKGLRNLLEIGVKIPPVPFAQKIFLAVSIVDRKVCKG